MIRAGFRKHYVGVTTFRWGVYLHFRWGLRWRHIKLGAWSQGTLRVSTRRQVRKDHRSPRYVRAWRLQISYWATTASVQHTPFVCGFMVYGGRRGPGATGPEAPPES